MDKIRIKLNKLELLWLIDILQRVRCHQKPNTQQWLIWMAVKALQRRVFKGGGMVVVRDKNSITLNGTEALVMWEVVDGVIPTDHEIAWKLSIQQKMEKELERQMILDYEQL